MKSFGTLDLIINENDLPFNPERVLVFVQGEVGFLPWIVGSSMIKGREPNVEIFSRYMCVEPLNRMPEPVNPAWTITQVDEDTALLNITTWFPVSMMPDANHGMWFHTYPVMRDVVEFLRSEGAISLCFLAAINGNEQVDHSQGEGIIEINVGDNVSTDGEVPLILPAWFIPYLFDRFGGSSQILAILQDEGQYLDDQALGGLMIHMKSQGFPVDFDAMTETLKRVIQMQPAIENIERMFNGKDFDSEDWA